MASSAAQLLRFRGLLVTLTARELKARYRGSVLGFFWSLVNPLLLLAVYSFVFGFVFERPIGETTGPYALFLIAGLFPWVWASSSLLEGAMALTANAPLLRKAVFPGGLLPVVPVLANLIHLLLALPVIAAALAVGRWLGHPVGGWGSLLLPAVLALQLLMLAGMTLGLAALHAHFKDVRDLLANALTLLFVMAPILYPLAAVPFRPLRVLVAANPFTPFTLAYQATLFTGAPPAPSLWLQMAIWSALSWLAGSWLFGRLRETVVEAV
jgi:ABC-type polysaccharide/polyol phosphate export permease